jgi:hypothetical protein
VNTNRRSIRGEVASGAEDRIIVDDGMFTHGYKIVEFHVWAQNQAASNDPQCFLALAENSGTRFSAADNRQIAWAGQSTSAGTRIDTFSVVDPNHVVIRDLYVRNIDTLVGGFANYLVVIEPITLTEPQGILALVKERAQDDL